MNENQLQQMQKDITALKGQLTDLLIKYDILAEKTEKQNPREDSEKISEISKIKEHLGDMSAEVLIQMANAFEQDYDNETQKNLEDLRKRRKDPKAVSELREFDFRRVQYKLILQRLEELGQQHKPIANSSSSIKEITQKIKEHNKKYDEKMTEQQKQQHKKEHEELLQKLRDVQDGKDE